MIEWTMAHPWMTFFLIMVAFLCTESVALGFFNMLGIRKKK